jgi:hypothetical protein
MTVKFPFPNDFTVEYTRTLRIEEDFWEFPTGEGYEYEDVVVVRDTFIFRPWVVGKPVMQFLTAYRELWMLEVDYSDWLDNQAEEDIALFTPGWRFYLHSIPLPENYTGPTNKNSLLRNTTNYIDYLRDFVRSTWMETTPWIFNIAIDDELYPQGGIPALKPTPTNWKAILDELKQQIRQEYLYGDIFTLNNPRGF